jgi:hypothetical protein
MRARGTDQPLHDESLLRLPLVAQMLADRQIRLVPRANDRSWYYESVIPFSVSGFAPTQSAVFYDARSFLARWLADPRSSARRYNEGDFLVRELLFAVHDYLHCWAYLAINELRPELSFGTAPLDERNLEDHVFCHLLTEVVATVGLDYWYLATTSLNRVVPIGTQHRGTAVDYHEDHADEYRRFCPDFVVQEPRFFERLLDFYCSGEFHGFDRADLQQSPMLLRWLRHELEYGELQRRYARAWLSYLAPRPITLAKKQWTRPVAATARWQRSLAAEIGRRLWRKVKEDDRSSWSFRFDPAHVWTAPRERALDYRFVNLRVVAAPEGRAQLLEGVPYYLAQLVAGRRFDAFDKDERALVSLLFHRSEVDALQALVRKKPAVARAGDEPRDLLFLN